MNTVTWAVGLAFVVILSLWSADHMRQSEAAAVKRADTLEEERDRLAAYNTDLSAALTSQAVLQSQITEISRATQLLNTNLNKQSTFINRNFEELKRNDKQIADYLGGSVPGDLGVQYARPETTDPLAYRAGAAGVLPGPVSASKSTATEGQ
ncbi:hypothetical protein HZF02_32925 (plasmid) [Pseudomonas yamanorum]|nr:hypothetical protein HZF02_32925 [Pseudomonas yamanorum]